MQVFSVLKLDSIAPPGALLGPGAPAMLLQTMNSQSNASWFTSKDNIFSSTHNTFIRDFVAPLARISAAAEQVSLTALNANIYRPINCLEDLRHMPPIMHQAMLTFEPMRKLLEKGQIQGWGYQPINLPSHDPYFHLMNNGVVDTALAPVVDDFYEMSFTWTSTDPELNADETRHIRTAREFVQSILNETDLDPTSPDDYRG